MDTAVLLASIFIGTPSGPIANRSVILSIPILVPYFVAAVFATTYSHSIAGTTSTIYLPSFFKNALLNIKTTIVFGIPSIAALLFNKALYGVFQPSFAIGNILEAWHSSQRIN
ncbi:hypothetical protein D3C80_348280 [compost metagenome]